MEGWKENNNPLFGKRKGGREKRIKGAMAPSRLTKSHSTHFRWIGGKSKKKKKGQIIGIFTFKKSSI